MMEEARDDRRTASSALSADAPRTASHALPEGLELVRTDHGLALCGEGMELIASFTHMLPRIKPANLQRELLLKAIRIKNGGDSLRVIDATAGFGEDSFLLAAAGHDVTMFEHNPVIAALLRDALERSACDPRLAPISARMHLVEGDSTQLLSACSPSPDAVYLDPMFPERSKSAAVKKKFQLLHRIERPCTDEVDLLEAALALRPRRIVIKRTRKGPYLAGRKPHYSLEGTTIRYDCFSFSS